MNMKNEKLVLTIVAYLLLSCVTLAGTIILSTDIELPAPDPDPNQVITVYFHSDAPLLFMNLLIRVNGDATLVGMMDQTNCGQYGWDESAFTCTVNPDNSIELFGLNWNENTASTVGYLQFTCNSGKVYIYLDNEESMAVSWTEAHTVSTESIRVGTLTLPPLIERDEPEFSISRNPLTPTDPCWLDLQSLFTMTRFAEMSTGPEYLEYGEPFPAVVIYSDITTNQVWEPNCVYIVAAQIYVQALLVIEPGTTVLFDFNCGMLVNNGGTLISEGTPDKPIIYSPLLAVDYEVEEDTYIGIGNWWEWYRIFRYQYISPMIIESTASPATSVSYSFVEGAQAGVILDGITLDKPIENNTFFGNMYGVYEVGPALTDVRNNLFYVHEKSAIEIVATLDPNDVPERILNIEHNTCDYGWTYGIIFHGMDDPNGPMPYVVLANNVMTENYGCGLYLNGCFHYMSLSNGYHMNEYDKNYDFMEFNPVHSAIYPYQPEFGDDPRLWHRFVPDCNFIDAGLVSIAQTSLVGMSTDLEGRPDSGMLDLGYHYMDWNFIRTSGVDDILAIADYWLCYDPADPNSPNYVDPNFVTDPNDLADLLQFGGDLDHSGFVDLEDFAVLSRSWRAAPDAPDLVPVIGGNPDEGWIALTASQPSTDTAFVYAYINGQYIGQVYSAGSNIEKYCDLTNFGNRPLEIKFIVMDMDENVTNSLPCLYEPDEPL
ncbi:MAG: right-handed parallel beta-helix repeat-containing protein, partial [Sulfurimonas sp.]|uniref:right-handed parallel beta-helix repeat-containing protein n=1 Tax=Sulfurimonas sp. TaxID=2022749 RepID=UPI0025E97097